MDDPDSARPPSLKLAIRPAGGGDRKFVEWLAEEAFSRFGAYRQVLGEGFDRDGVVTVVAEDRGRPVGFAMVDLSGLRVGRAYLAAIAVDPERRRTGIGRALLDAAEEIARTPRPDGAARVLVLETAVDNEAAIGLFRRAGFVPLPRARGRYPAGQRSVGMIKSVQPRGR